MSNQRELLSGVGRDVLRQWLNMVLAVAQVIVTGICFYTGLSFEDATRNDAVPPPLIPAGWAFAIWSVIYLGCILYAVYQAQPSQRENPRLRRIGWSTAAVFLGPCLWLVAARFNREWLTVVCILWMLVFLYRAFVPVWAWTQVSRAERYLVVAPLSVFTGWISAAVFANTASAIVDSHWPALLLSETAWSLIAVGVASLLGAVVIWRSRGNVWFTGTLVWAFLAIAMQDFNADFNPVVGNGALVGCLVLVVALIAVRWPDGHNLVRA